MIHNSLEWQTRRADLVAQIVSVNYSKDLRMLMWNIDELVTRLSKAEVIARRNGKKISELPELITVNEAIDFLEKWIVMAALLKN
jgi:hypothetical protein